jgi:hypothetical protein
MATGTSSLEGARAERNFGAAKSAIEDVIYDLVQGLQDIEALRAQTARRLLERVEIAVGQLAANTPALTPRTASENRAVANPIQSITLLTALLARQLRHPACSPAKRCCPHHPQ